VVLVVGMAVVLAANAFWGSTPALALLALTLLVYTGIALVNMRNVIPYYRLQGQATMAKRRLSAAERSEQR